MSFVSVIGPRENENANDHFIRVIHGMYHGSDELKDISHLELVLMAFNQLDASNGKPEVDSYDANGVRKSHIVYNVPESVFRDVEVHRYDGIPHFPDFFSAVDQFGVTGKLGNSPAGFMIDCYLAHVCPTQTSAFSQNSTNDEIRAFADEIFRLQNSSGENAYTQKSFRRGVVNLQEFGITPMEASICGGELRFGGKANGEIVTELMGSLQRYPEFKPEQYFLGAYTFKIDGHKTIGNPEQVGEVIGDLKLRVYSAFEDKGRRVAA